MRELIISLTENNKFRVGEIQRLKVDVELKSTEKSELNAQLVELHQLLKWPPKEDAAALESRRNELVHRIKILSGSKNAFRAKEVLQELNEPRKKWQKALEEFQSTKAARSKLYAGTDVDAESNKLSTAITQSIASIKSLG